MPPFQIVILLLMRRGRRRRLRIMRMMMHACMHPWLGYMCMGVEEVAECQPVHRTQLGLVLRHRSGIAAGTVSRLGGDWEFGKGDDSGGRLLLVGEDGFIKISKSFF
jgi:hypothetical protein